MNHESTSTNPRHQYHEHTQHAHQSKYESEKQTLKHEPGESNHQQHHEEHEHHDHAAHHRMMIADFKKRFFVSLLLTLLILVLSPMIQGWLSLNVRFPGSNYLLFALASFVFFYGGWPFLKGLFEELKDKSPGMMTLIAMAISVAYFYSTAVVFGLEGKFFYWELVTLIDVMLLGHWIEMKSVLGASRALEELAQLMPDEAHLIQDNDIVDVKTSELEPGNRVLIKPGEKVPSDGIVVKGNSYIDESVLTGESKPVEKKEGEELIGGSINGKGALEIQIENTGEDSYLSKVINLVREAQEGKSKTQRLADKAAFWLTVIALTVGFATLFWWLLYGKDFAFSIERMATVMVIACPHALGLAIPLVSAVSTALSAKNGLLIRNRTAFENARNISTIVFDKTGTLTEGKFGVSSIQTLDGQCDEKRIIQLAAALEKNSEHPIATGILDKAEEFGVESLQVLDFQAIKGKGVEGIVEGKPIKVVSPGYLKENEIQIPENLGSDEAATVVFLIVDSNLTGAISLADKIREESYDAIERLKRASIKCWMLTGDNERIAAKVSGELKLDGYFAEVLPHEKQEKIMALQSKGEFVAMTGDGVNDAPALAQANVGIAIGSGTDVAAETADIILVNSNPADVTSLILFGKATHRKIIQNLLWATGYNFFAIPLAAGVLYGAGIIISPAIGAILMSLSTVIVAINARMLKIEKEI